MEYRKGCPACDHTDPQLERELQALAELLVDSYLEDSLIPAHPRPSDRIDNAAGQVRLKESMKPNINDE
jgi:hypothetical protein